MIDENKYNQFGFPRTEAEIQGITIHETGNYEMDAQALHDWMNTECKTSQGTHYFVDSEKAVQAMPLDWAVYHTGKGIDWGNRYTIAIEICSNYNDELYHAAEDRAVALIHDLMEEYHIPSGMVFFHNDFDSRKHCPNRALNEYGSSRNFVYQKL